MILTIPVEIIELIIGDLNIYDIIKIKLTCKLLNEIVDSSKYRICRRDNTIWQNNICWGYYQGSGLYRRRYNGSILYTSNTWKDLSKVFIVSNTHIIYVKYDHRYPKRDMYKDCIFIDNRYAEFMCKDPIPISQQVRINLQTSRAKLIDIYTPTYCRLSILIGMFKNSKYIIISLPKEFIIDQ